ncbi:MAG: hypothetical protein WBI82_16705 [Sphaerochaeta sp.]
MYKREGKRQPLSAALPIDLPEDAPYKQQQSWGNHVPLVGRKTWRRQEIPGPPRLGKGKSVVDSGKEERKPRALPLQRQGPCVFLQSRSDEELDTIKEERKKEKEKEKERE